MGLGLGIDDILSNIIPVSIPGGDPSPATAAIEPGGNSSGAAAAVLTSHGTHEVTRNFLSGATEQAKEVMAATSQILSPSSNNTITSHILAPPSCPGTDSGFIMGFNASQKAMEKLLTYAGGSTIGWMFEQFDGNKERVRLAVQQTKDCAELGLLVRCRRVLGGLVECNVCGILIQDELFKRELAALVKIDLHKMLTHTV
jgi:hypothetical protein